MSRKLIYIQLLAVLVFLFTFGLVFYHYHSTEYIDDQGVVLGNFRNVDEYNLPAETEFKITQDFSSTYNNLAKITLSVNIFEPVTFYFTLIESDSNLAIRHGTIFVTEILNHVQYVVWKFEPLAGSQDKQYSLALIGKATNQEIILYTVPPHRSDAGQLTINGQNQSETRLILDWQYYNASPFKTMLQRITYAKPSIFNSTVTYIILIAVFAGLTLAILVMATRSLFNNKYE